MTRPLLVVGAGGFGREVLNIVHAVNVRRAEWELLGVADDGPSNASLRALHRSGTAHLGAIEEVARRAVVPGLCLVVAIGDPRVRQRVVVELSSYGDFPSLVHPAATVGPDVEVLEGCVVAPGARLSANIRLGSHVHVDQNVTIGHDSTVGAFSRLNPQACISGNVTMGHGCYCGANATVLPGVSVGTGAVIGAGAVVVRNVPAGRTVKGVPAR